MGRDDERQRGAKLRRAGNTRSPSALRGRAPSSLPSPHTPPSPSGGAGAPMSPRVPFGGWRSLRGSGEAGEAARRGPWRRGRSPREGPAPSWAGTVRAREGQNGGPEPSGAPRPLSHPAEGECCYYPLCRAALQSIRELLSNLDRLFAPSPMYNNSAPRAWRPGVSGSPVI